MEKQKINLSQGYKIRDQYAIHFLTLQVVYWIDIFTRKRYRDILIDSFRYCRKEKGLRIHAYVIMTNHVHVIFSAEKGNLSDILRDLKSYTSKNIMASVMEEGESRRNWMLALFRFAAKKHKRNNEYQLWTHENHPMELFTNNFLYQKLSYIHNNPVEAGIVDKAEEYLYSSARDYYGGGRGLIEIDRI